MTRVNVRITERVIPSEHRVFVLHPGVGYRFLDLFVAQNAVFLGLPGFERPPIDAWENEERYRAIEAQVRMARARAQWYRGGRSSRSEPSSDLADHYRKSGRPIRAVSEARALYGRAQRGDLVVVPDRGYFTEIRIAELTNSPDSDVRQIQVPEFGNERVPARRVRWIDHDQRKIDLPPFVIPLMQNRQALIQLPEEAKRAVYDIAFKSYVIADDDTSFYLGVRKDHILLDDIGEIAELTNYVISAFLALEAGNGEKFALLPMREAIDGFFDRSVLADTDVEIHSPGRFLVRARRELLSGFVLAVLAITTADVGDAIASGELSPPNSVKISRIDGDTEVEYEQEVVDYVNRMMEHFGQSTWRMLCEKSQVCRERAGLNVAASVDVAASADAD